MKLTPKLIALLMCLERILTKMPAKMRAVAEKKDVNKLKHAHATVIVYWQQNVAQLRKGKSGRDLTSI